MMLITQNPAIWNLLFNNQDKVSGPTPIWLQYFTWGGIILIVILLNYMILQLFKK